MKKSNHKIKNTKSFTSAGIPNASPAKAFEMCRSGAAIIDIRGAYITTYKKFGVAEVFYFPKAGKSLPPDKLNKDRTYIVAETSTGIRSKEIVRELLDKGFHSVYNLAGGFVEWERDGFPVEENKKARLTGSCMCQLRPRERDK
ncbi:MAG: hypothetical protein KFF49_04495 [Bacteroidales bacterium]|nr:hypothetical protein [Bacteroidales bacterium]